MDIDLVMNIVTAIVIYRLLSILANLIWQIGEVIVKGIQDHE